VCVSHHLQKRFYQVVSRLKVWASLPQLPKRLAFFLLQILWPAEKEPGDLLCRESTRGLSGLVADGEPLLRAEKLNASNVSKYR